ncbi:hypothetical protein [Caballeronia arvi]|uniref:hypothetical protein n=1 Tax=Caballeronia arvi TaxID=1777135 RepID=UPI000772AF8E|nr:hypothetical protein [Caballeronia arvi]
MVEVVPAANVTGSGLSSGLGGGLKGSDPGDIPARLTPAPLERLAVPRALSGADGDNRSTPFCYIQENDDLDAVGAYLNRYRD